MVDYLFELFNSAYIQTNLSLFSELLRLIDICTKYDDNFSEKILNIGMLPNLVESLSKDDLNHLDTLRITTIFGNILALENLNIDVK